MAKHLNTIFPVVTLIEPLFGKSKEDLREELVASGNKVLELPKSFELEESEMLEVADLDLELENKTIKNYIPGAVEIPLQKLFDAGFTINCYLKDSTEDCLDDRKGSGVLVFNIQHNNPDKSFMVDGYSVNFDPISEIEITSLNTVILNDQKPGIFGEKFQIDKALKYSSIKIRDIILEKEEAKKALLAKLEEYNKNPEKREKDTKKAFENLKFKHAQLKAKGTSADMVTEFNNGALKILGSIAGINNLESFDQLKDLPIFKDEIAKGGSFGELLNKFCDMASKIGNKEDTVETKNSEATEEK